MNLRSLSCLNFRKTKNCFLIGQKFGVRSNLTKSKLLSKTSESISADWIFKPDQGKNKGRNFSGIRALTTVRISHGNRF